MLLANATRIAVAHYNISSRIYAGRGAAAAATRAPGLDSRWAWPQPGHSVKVFFVDRIIIK